MSDTTIGPPPEAPEAEGDSTPDDGLPKAPKDADDDVATGYAVYDRTLGRYVGEVKRGDTKPTKAEVAKLVPKGHIFAIVRV